MDLTAFAREVGPEGPVTCVGGRTQWEVGGLPPDGVREVWAPAGIVALEPEEMTVRCGAGTAVADLQAALAEQGQTVTLPERPGATVGGVLAVGRSGVLRLGHGPVRDAVLQVRFVDAAGQVVKAGGPTVKNVSGFDLCRLLVGSLGTIGMLGEVILRTRPVPACRRWLAGPTDPFLLRRRLYRPAAVLWDGTTTWVCLEGDPRDCEAQAALAPELTDVAGPPPLPTGGRASVAPGQLRSLTGAFVAEVGVGVVHLEQPWRRPPVAPAVAELHRRLAERFDPLGRLNPGRSPLAV